MTQALDVRTQKICLNCKHWCNPVDAKGMPTGYRGKCQKGQTCGGLDTIAYWQTCRQFEVD
jgi:hypothetical protein